MTVRVENPLPAAEADPAAIMTQGGDGRILLDPATGLNRYHSAPRPSATLAYASSTANDISPAAYAHVAAVAPDWGGALSPAGYARALAALRRRIRFAYALRDDVEIVFAPSGTDLEYVALASSAGRAAQGTHNLLLGADEVGSGCIHSAHGRYFAETTALGVATQPGQPVAGLRVDLVDIEVRDAQGRVRRSAEIAAQMAAACDTAAGAGRHPIVHIVHGSKTGLILPSLAEADALRTKGASLVVDACQARITSAAIRDYLERDAIVFVTGSKFMGGPPFSGFALVPRAVARAAPPLPEGLATIFRRAEWPEGWPGAGILPDGTNPGLLLRLEAAIFELERFQALAAADVERVILAFHAAIRAEIVERTPARRVAPYPPGERDEADTHPIEMRSLSTLDLSGWGGGATPDRGPGQASSRRAATFEDAQAWHKALLDHGVRLGQPVKCIRLAGGGWGATLRIGLAMWQVADRAALPQQALASSFADDMARVREALVAVAG